MVPRSASCRSSRTISKGWTDDALRRKVPTACLRRSGATAVLVLAIRWPGVGPGLVGDPGLALLNRLVFGASTAPAGALLAVCAGLIVLRSRRADTILLAVGVVVLLGQLAAWRDVRPAAASLARGLPHPRSVIDRAASGTTVTWALGPGSPPPEQVAEVRIWNKSITRAVAVDPATARKWPGSSSPRPLTAACG